MPEGGHDIGRVEAVGYLVNQAMPGADIGNVLGCWEISYGGGVLGG